MSSPSQQTKVQPVSLKNHSPASAPSALAPPAAMPVSTAPVSTDFVSTTAVRLLLSQWVGIILLSLLGSTAFLAAPAQAEGSKDLVDSGAGGNRPYIDFRNDSTGGIARKTIIKVYAEAGETINLASSAVGIGQGEILYRRPGGGSATQSCGSLGRIANRTEEDTKNYTSTCVVTVGPAETGVWEIDFVSPRESSRTDPAPIAATSNWTQGNHGYVAAWDATVKDASGTALTGRVYANYFAFNMGGFSNRALQSDFVVLTDAGYQYRVDLNGLDPYGFLFFSNNRGYQDSNGPLFQSVNLPSPANSLQNPGDPDSGGNVTHKVFLNPPNVPETANALTPFGSTWLDTQLVAPPTPQNFAFSGIEANTPNQAGTNPLGGKFSFSNTGTTSSSYSITLDLNENGILGDGSDRTFLGVAAPGLNEVLWDGLDGNGNPVPAGSTPYNAAVTLYNGEAHFPMLDAETNQDGIIIERLNQPLGAINPPNAFDVYYDDSEIGGSAVLPNSNITGSPPVVSTPAGENSSGGAHVFGNNFGNNRGIDTWVYYPSSSVILDGGISIREADLSVTKTDNLTVTDSGAQLTYDIKVTNAGPSNVVGATFTDNIPNSLENVSWSCSVTGTGSCANNSGTGNSISELLNLDNGDVATFTVQASVVTNATGTITNTATITRPADVTDPKNGPGDGNSDDNDNNNVATDITTINSTRDLTLVKRITAIDGTAITTVTNDGIANSGDDKTNWPTNYLQGSIGGEIVAPGEEIEYSIYFLSSGNSNITNVDICDMVPANTTYVDGSLAIALGTANTSQPPVFTALTDIPDGDGGERFTGTPPAGLNCLTDPGRGGVRVNLATNPASLPPATPTGTAQSYGLIRFRVRVD